MSNSYRLVFSMKKLKSCLVLTWGTMITALTSSATSCGKPHWRPLHCMEESSAMWSWHKFFLWLTTMLAVLMQEEELTDPQSLSWHSMDCNYSFSVLSTCSLFDKEFLLKPRFLDSCLVTYIWRPTALLYYTVELVIFATAVGCYSSWYELGMNSSCDWLPCWQCLYKLQFAPFILNYTCKWIHVIAS